MTDRLRLLAAAALAVLLAACSSAPAPSTTSTPAPFPADFDPVRLAAAGIDPAAIRCNRTNHWSPSLPDDAAATARDLADRLEPWWRELSPDERQAAEREIAKTVFLRMIRTVVVDGAGNNLGAVPLEGYEWTDERGTKRPVILFRTGLTAEPDAPGSCFSSLLDAGDVRHVVNLYDGDLPTADLLGAEARAAAARGATYHSADDGAGTDGYGPWRDQLRRAFDDPVVRDEATRSLARLVREQVLAPGGGPHRGNVHVHCGGGMHRTGLVVGIVEKCVNRTPLDEVEANYRAHVGWRSAAEPGGFEEHHVTFLREFDCRLLDPPPAP